MANAKEQGKKAETKVDNKKAKAKPEKKKVNAFSSILKRVTKFFKDLKGETKKVVWPTPKAVFKNMGVVLITVLIATLFVFALDTVFMNLLGLVMDVAR